MKKLMSVMLGASLLMGTMAFAQDKPAADTTTATGEKKAKKAKKAKTADGAAKTDEKAPK